MHFKLVNALATFQAMIYGIFHDLFDRSVLAYIDDILVYATTLAEYNWLVNFVLSCLAANNLYLSLNKCI